MYFGINCCLKGRFVRFQVFEIGSKHGFLYSFLLGSLVRLLPELLSYPNIIGFDTVHYAASLKEGVVWHHWSNVFTQRWLLYSLLITIHRMTHLDPQITLKIVSPFLYGLNVTGICFFANKVLKWKPKKGLLGSILFSFHIAALRISWDLYRNILGLSSLMFTLSMISEVENGKKVPYFVILSILTVFSHELATITLLAVISVVILNNMRKCCRHKASELLVSILPALIIYISGVYLQMKPIPYKIETNVISIDDINPAHPWGLYLLTDYLKVSVPYEQYSTYAELVIHVLSFYTILYLVWMPLMIKGFFRERILDIWTTLLLVGSFNAIITPTSALLLWERWMIMLVYPFTFYVTNGVDIAWSRKKSNEWRRAKAVIAVTAIMGVLFITLPVAFPFPTTVLYLPCSMQQNTIPLEDVSGTTACLRWLNHNMDGSAVVLVHHAFLSWTGLYLDKNHTIVYYAMNITKAVEVAQQNGFKDIYLIWWSQNIGWYPNIRIPENFKLTYTNGRIGVYLLQ